MVVGSLQNPCMILADSIFLVLGLGAHSESSWAATATTRSDKIYIERREVRAKRGLQMVMFCSCSDEKCLLLLEKDYLLNVSCLHASLQVILSRAGLCGCITSKKVLSEWNRCRSSYANTRLSCNNSNRVLDFTCQTSVERSLASPTRGLEDFESWLQRIFPTCLIQSA